MSTLVWVDICALRAGASQLEPDNLKHDGKMNFGEELRDAKVWKDILPAGHGIGAIHDLPPASELCARLIQEYDDTCRELADSFSP